MKYQECIKDDDICTSYLDYKISGGIKVKNFDKILDLLDDYIELKENMNTNKYC